MRILSRVITRRELLAQLLNKSLSSNLSRNRNSLHQVRAIALSSHVRGHQEQNTPAKAPASSAEKPQWEREDRTRIFYGFNDEDEVRDRIHMHLTAFVSVFVFFGFAGFMIYYVPDQNCKEWIQREAFLQMSKRKAKGEPLVSPDLIPLDNVKLPSDEELADTEIII